MNTIFFLIITLTLLFSGCMISSNTIYKISKSYVGEYKLSDTTLIRQNEKHRFGKTKCDYFV